MTQDTAKEYTTTDGTAVTDDEASNLIADEKELSSLCDFDNQHGCHILRGAKSGGSASS